MTPKQVNDFVDAMPIEDKDKKTLKEKIKAAVDNFNIGVAESAFNWDSTSGIWYAGQDAPQYILGYNDVYDWGFKKAEDVAYYIDSLNVSSTTIKSTFLYDSVYYKKPMEWRIQAWKGNYAQLGVGAEIGVYYRDPENDDMEHYPSVKTTGGKNGMGDRQQMQYSLYENDKSNMAMFHIGPKYHWWLAAFCPRYDHLNPEEMKFEGSIVLKDPDMAREFDKNIKKEKRTKLAYIRNGSEIIIVKWE